MIAATSRFSVAVAELYMSQVVRSANCHDSEHQTSQSFDPKLISFPRFWTFHVQPHSTQAGWLEPYF
jgi:CRISPR/Cas system-associated protein Csx1